MERVDCAGCSHFFITWDIGAPYGCSAWGIKFAQHPQNAVYASSGIQCQLFKPKSGGRLVRGGVSNQKKEGGPSYHGKL
ncbi:MAG: hypothetical protein WCF58_20070 [Syntrophobacteraceae bacterium]